MFGFWDLLLIGIVSTQAVIAAYVIHPKWKAFIITLPFPFTAAYLAVGQQISAANVLALALGFFFMQTIRILYTRWKIPILFAILLAISEYCLSGILILHVLPLNETTFRLSVFSVMIAAIFLLRLMPKREEQGGRTPLPLRIKLPLTVVLVSFLILIKGQLGGFMTLFPVVTVFTAYDARRSLWTLGRQVPVIMLTQIPMLAAIHVTEPAFGTVPALLLGWTTFLIGLFILQYRVLFGKRAAGVQPKQDHGASAKSYKKGIGK